MNYKSMTHAVTPVKAGPYDNGALMGTLSKGLPKELVLSPGCQTSGGVDNFYEYDHTRETVSDYIQEKNMPNSFSKITMYNPLM